MAYINSKNSVYFFMTLLQQKADIAICFHDVSLAEVVKVTVRISNAIFSLIFLVDCRANQDVCDKKKSPDYTGDFFFANNTINPMTLCSKAST